MSGPGRRCAQFDGGCVVLLLLQMSREIVSSAGKRLAREIF